MTSRTRDRPAQGAGARPDESVAGSVVDVRNIDTLAREMVVAAHGGAIAIVDAAGRQKLVEPLLK